MSTIGTEISRSYSDGYTACALQARMRSDRSAEFGFIATLTVLFVGSSALTIIWCKSMSAMGGMPMPGGWTMSMAWMRMPGQTWLGSASWFLGMWMAMTAAMMLPSLAPMLARYRQAVGESAGARLGRLTVLVGLGYFFVWTAIGLGVFLLGFALSALEMQHEKLSRAVPLAVGVTVLAVGAMQLTAWKARCLACCRKTPDRGRVHPARIATAWRHGIEMGVQCAYCCFGVMAILVVLGVMDMRLMAVATACVTAERLAPAGIVVARIIGFAIVAFGFVLIARAAAHC